MNSLERAKRFLREKTSRLALSVVPLAALAISAVPAHAGPVTFRVGSGSFLGNCEAGAFSGSASCYSFQINSTGGNTGANWVGIGGSGSTSSGYIALGVSGGGASGSIGSGSIPVSWDFTISSSGAGTVTWNVFFNVFLSGGGAPSFSQSGSVMLDDSSAIVKGSGSISISGGSITAYSVDVSTSGGIAYNLNVPLLGSLDMNPQSQTATPEPATVFLLPSAGALLFLRRRKRLV